MVQSSIAPRRWTPDEETLLLQLLAKGEKSADIAAALKRTSASVDRKASQLRMNARVRDST